MEEEKEITIVRTDRMEDGALIGFSDGTTVLYSAALLLSMIGQARQVQARDPEED